MDDSRTDVASKSGAKEPPRKRHRRLLGATIVFLTLNLLGVGALAAKGAIPGRTCGGGSSGYSGGGGPCHVDLSIEKFDFPDPVAVQGRLVYLLEVTNKGPDSVGFLEVQDRVPGSFRIDWVLMPQRPYGECSVQANLVFCEFYGLSHHQRLAVSIVVRPNRPGRFNNVATVEFSGTDTNPANNWASAKTTVH